MLYYVYILTLSWREYVLINMSANWEGVSAALDRDCCR